MPVTISDISRIRRKTAKEQSFNFDGFLYGLNSYLLPHQIDVKEVAKLVNYKVAGGGRLESRPAITKYTSTATTGGASIIYAVKAPVGATEYELLIDENYLLYYVSSSAPVAIATLEGEATLMPFNGVVVVMDGSYLKYMDGVSGGSVKLCYDAGTGESGYQFDNDAGSNDKSIALYGVTRVAYKFTSQSWDTKYTIPPTAMVAKLSKYGTPTGTVYAVVRNATTDATMAKTSLSTAQALYTGSLATLYSVNFAAADVTTELSGSVAYYASVEHAGGTSGAYVAVHCTTGSGLNAFQYTGSAWVASGGSNPIVSLQPGRPPKGKFGTIYKRRPFIGGDPDNPGYVWYGNLTHLDWSTSDGGGYIGLIDSDANNFPIGAVSVIYEDLYVYGKETQPAISRLSGSSPSSYVLSEISRQGWTTHKVIQNATNDLWSASRGGVYPLSGVTEYGDIRLYSAADPVTDRFIDYWDTDDAISGYFHRDGQYWIAFPNYWRVLVSRARTPESFQNRARYPWSEYEFYRDEFTSSSYKWIANGSEYYLQAAAGGDPSIVQPDFVTLDGLKIEEGTAGSLDDHEWDYALDPTSAYYTIYVKDATGDPDTSGVVIRSVITPKCIASWDGKMFIGGSDGFLYATDTTAYKDINSIQIKPAGKTKYIEAGYGYLNLLQWQVDMQSRGGASLTVKLYINSVQLAATTSTILPISDLLVLSDLDMDVGDATYAIGSDQTPLWHRMNVLARSFQVSFENATLVGYPLFVNGLKILYKKMQR